MSKKIGFEKKGISTLYAFKSPKLFEQFKNTGAVVEEGIVIVSVTVDEKDNIIKPKKTETINETKEPYMVTPASYSVYGNLYIPMDNSKELLELYNGIKKIAIRREKLDMRELRTFGDKVRYIYSAAFYGNNDNHYKSTGLRKLTFVLWLFCGVLNTLSGKTLLYVLNYLCAILQLDIYELVCIVKASTIDSRKKQYILDSIEKNGINLSGIPADNEIRLYTRIDNADRYPEINELMEKNSTFSL